LALSAVIDQFAVQLSHVDRRVYETSDLRVAWHRSESEEYLCARVLAYGLECRPGLAFTRGLAEPGQPALEVRDLTGVLQSWIEIGTPDAAQLHSGPVSVHRLVAGQLWSLTGSFTDRCRSRRVESCGPRDG
jgi:uncharacterized protein YaeQ